MCSASLAPIFKMLIKITDLVENTCSPLLLQDHTYAEVCHSVLLYMLLICNQIGFKLETKTFLPCKWGY